MNVFDSLLTAVRRQEDAGAVAGMLREEMSRYQELADRIPKIKLHIVIQGVRQDAVSE